jgi:hypothetical protein
VSLAAVEVIAELISLPTFEEEYLINDCHLFNTLLVKARTVFTSKLTFKSRCIGVLKAQFLRNLLWILSNAIADNLQSQQ